MKAMIVIILTAVFVNNYVLQQFLGICPFLGVSKKLDQATGMSIAVIFVMLLATAVYVRLGLALDLWSRAWWVFAVAGILCGVVCIVLNPYKDED